MPAVSTTLSSIKSCSRTGSRLRMLFWKCRELPTSLRSAAAPLSCRYFRRREGVISMYQVRYGAKPTVEEIATLKDAVERAGQLISDNYGNVTVRDGEGNEISGDDLLACYLGVMKLTS